MFFLFLATLCSSLIALIFKYAENSNTNRYAITSSNYFIAFSTSLFMIFYKDLFKNITKENTFLNEFKLLHSNNIHTLSPYSSIIWGIIVGSIAGIFFFLSFIFYQKSVKTSVAFPIYSAGSIVLINIGGFFIFKEKLSNKNKLAIVLTIIALVLIN